MGAYLPPPPGQYPPPYDRFAAKAQRQAMKAQDRALRAQVKMQRTQYKAQFRAQRRSLRRNSIVGPILLLVLGVVFLLAQLGRLTWSQSLEWYGRWWPAVLIAAGVLLLIEWAIDQRRPDAQGHVRVLGGGVISLLILLVVLGLSSRAMIFGLNWRDRTFGHGYTNFDHLFGDRHDADTSDSSAIAPGVALVIRNPHGDVTVTGTSTDGQVHVSEHTETYAWKDSDASEKADRLEPAFSTEGKEMSLNIAAVEGGQADLTIEVPATSEVKIEADRGDVNVSDVQAAVSINANHGDVNASNIESALNVHVNDNDASITLHSIHGPVLLAGHSGDIDISEVTGDLTLQGDFFGSTNVQHVTGGLRFETSRTRFSAARLDDEFSIDSDSLDASELLGPVVLSTADKNITLDRVQGSVNVTNRNGTVNVTNAAPLAAISIVNTRGSVDLGLPNNAAFVLNAQTRNGDMENDFGLSPQGSSQSRTLRGNVHNGGPTVTISTTDGDVTVRRSSVAPLPPIPPMPPLPPAAPNGIRPPRPPRPPVPPRPPLPPQPVGGVSF